MGTNYYLHKNVCKHCGRSEEPIHIGKSSGGWCFSLHVMPERGVKDLDDWKRLWSEPDAQIKDEYGEIHTPQQMLEIVTDRSWHSPISDEMAKKSGYTSFSSLLELNHAVEGPNNLIRCKITVNHCIGHGPGTWDLIVGEFS